MSSQEAKAAVPDQDPDKLPEVAEFRDQPPEGHSDKMLIDLDAILLDVGGWGCYQQVLFYALNLPVIFSTSIMFAVTVFSVAVPKFRCRVDACDAANATYSDASAKSFSAFTIPAGTESAQCQMFEFFNLSSADQCSAEQFNHLSTVDCHDWIYDQSVYTSTFAAEVNMVCGKSWQGPMFQSVYFAGILVAALAMGLLSDTFGRRHVAMACMFVVSAFSVGLYFSHDVVSFTIIAFIMSVADTGLFLVIFVLSLEMVGPAKRVCCGMIVMVSFTVGELLVSGLAYWQRDWRPVLLYSAVPLFVLLLLWPVLPESIRWLLAKQRLKKAQEETDRISKFNKTPLVDIHNYRLKSSTEESAERETYLDMIKEWKLLFRLLNLSYTWLVINLAYYGLSLTSVNLSGDPYLNFFLVSLVEIPGNLIPLVGMEKIGRRWTLVISLVVGGLALLAAAVVDATGKSGTDFNYWFNLVASLIGKCGMTSAFAVVYVYTSELFPTSVRTTAVGTCSTIGHSGAVITPWVSDLVKSRPWIAMVIFGSSTVISGLLSLLLPETLGRHLPETIAQARDLDKATEENKG